MAVKKKTVKRTANPQSILFIGTSYTKFGPYNIAKLVKLLGASHHPPVALVTEACAIEQTTLMQHWEEEGTPGKIETGNWTHVVLQEQRLRPVTDNAEFKKYVGKFYTLIASKSAKTVLFMGWPKRGEWNAYYAAIAGKFDEIHAEYKLKGKDLPVAAVATGWNLAKEQNINWLFQVGGWHAAKNGQYLNALILFATLTGKSPLGLSDAGLGIGPKDKRALQQIAFDVTHLPK